MIKGHVVFVLGAGASVPFGFPTGPELVSAILGIRKEHVPQRLDGLMCDRVCEEMGFHPSLMTALQLSLRHSQVNSIDEFLAQPAHKDFVEMGRFLIAALLIPKEDASVLFTDGVGSNRNWYQILWSHLRDYGTIDLILDRAQVTFVTYNYDRSLEHYLYTVMRHHFQADSKSIDQFLERTIFHVHGTLGSYRKIGGGPYRRYIIECGLESIRAAMQGIRIVHEVDRLHNHDLIRARLEKADRVVFLGFHYHHENLRKLFSGVRRRNMRVSGSSFGLSKLEWQTAQRRIAQMLEMEEQDVMIGGASNLGCFDYLREHFEFE